jgi:PAS domain S-box-containing protein
MKKDQKTDDIFADSATLRKRAEDALSSNPLSHDDPDCMSPEAIKNLVHDLSVHQIELEMQNDELRRTQEDLETTRDKYTDLYDFSPVGYAIINDKGIITETNLTLTQMLGVERNQVAGKPFSDFVYGNDQDTFLMHRRRLSETESGQSMELRLLKKEENWFYATVECMVVKTGDSPAKQVRMAVSDSTERIQSEKTIQESRQAWEDTFNAISDWVSLIDVKTGQILETNSAGELLLGKSRQEIIGQTCWNLVHGTDEPIADCPLRRMLDSGQRELSEIYLEPSKKWLAVTADPIRDEKNNISRAVHIIRDITARKQAEKIMRLHTEIITNMMEGVCLTRIGDGVIVYTNPEFEKMFGYSESEMLEKHVSILNAPTDKSPEETATEIIGDLVKEGVWEGAVNNIKKDGSPFWTFARCTMFEHPEHGPVLLSVQTDVTQQRLTQQALLASEKKHRSFLDNINAGVIAHAPDTSILYCNPTALEFLDLTMDQIIGKKSTDPQWKFLNNNGTEMSVDDYPIARALNNK